jgi:thioesterase domain-containing protein/acyl carrier protein
LPEGGVTSKLRFIRVSTGRLDADIADDMERLFGIPLVENYSSTETATITSNPVSMTARKRGTVGISLGCDIKIVGDDGAALGAGEKGEIVVRGAQVIDAYDNNDDANAEAFNEGWFRTGDEGCFDDDGYLTLTGRIKEMISRGGEKVNPLEVDAVLLGHPEVLDAATFPIPHSTLGEEVAAVVVPAPGVSPDKDELSRFLLAALSGFKVPKQIVFADEIPRSAAGKVQRRLLAEVLGVEPLAVATGPHRDFEREPTAFEYRLFSIWRNVLGIRNFSLNDDFFLLGGDSLRAVELFMVIERELGQRLPVASLFEAGTVAKMAKLIEEGEPQGCIVTIQPDGLRPPFFCVHGATGQVIGFKHLARYLGDDQPFYGIQAIGWDATTPPFTRTRDMVTHYVAEMRKVQPHGPYYLGGYSFGGRIAVHMANMLKEAGEEVAFLAILDTASLVGRQYVTFRQWLERIQAPPGPGRIGLAFYYAWYRLRKGFDGAYDRVRRAVLFPIREYYRMSGKSVPMSMRRPDRLNTLIRIEHKRMPAYDGDAVYFKTEIKKGSMAHPDLKDSWSRVIKGRLDVIPVSGTHSNMIREPHVRDLAEKLDGVLARAQAGERK